MSSPAASLNHQSLHVALPSARKKIWVDLDNSPHVPFFRPIIDELRKRNYEVLVTAGTHTGARTP